MLRGQEILDPRVRRATAVELSAREEAPRCPERARPGFDWGIGHQQVNEPLRRCHRELRGRPASPHPAWALGHGIRHSGEQLVMYQEVAADGHERPLGLGESGR